MDCAKKCKMSEERYSNIINKKAFAKRLANQFKPKKEHPGGCACMGLSCDDLSCSVFWELFLHHPEKVLELEQKIKKWREKEELRSKGMNDLLDKASVLIIKDIIDTCICNCPDHDNYNCKDALNCEVFQWIVEYKKQKGLDPNKFLPSNEKWLKNN